MFPDVSRLAGILRPLAAAGLRIGREPLVQFFAAALLLFSADGLMHGSQQRPAGEVITISQGRVQQLADSYRLLAGRMPSRAELQALVDDFADEEVDYREAVAMGLDLDDTIVRRRMRQKLEFLSEDADASEPPSDEQLAAWLASHAADYRRRERISFRHVLASKDQRADTANADATAFLDKLRSGVDPEGLGDASMLPAALPLTTEEGVAALFGRAFAASVFAHAGEGWFGPVGSPFGAHDVLILSRESASDPTVDEVRDKLISDWIEARRAAKRNEFQARLRQRYHITVDWPEPYANEGE
jgi:hypothetical protein